MLITDVLDEYLEQQAANGRSPHTIAQACRHVLALCRWMAYEGLSGKIQDLTPQHVARFLVDQQRHAGREDRRKATTVNAVRSSIRTFFGFAEAADYVQRSPARLVRRAQTSPPPPRALSEAEQRRLLDALAGARTPVEQRDRVLFTLLLRCGLRIGSALALRVADVDLDSGELAIRGKGDRRDRVLVPRDIVPLLRAWVEEVGEGWLFPGNGRAPLHVRSADRRFEGWAKRAELRVGASPHSLRHAFATGLLRRTGNLAVVQRALTHRSIASTLVYAQCDDAILRAALGA